MNLELAKKEEFIKLRARGESFDIISKKLDISKPTLIKLNRELLEKIKDQKTEFDRQFLFDIQRRTRSRIKILVSELDKAHNVLKRHNYEKMTTKELTMLIVKYEKELNSLVSTISTNVPELLVVEVVRGRAEDHFEEHR